MEPVGGEGEKRGVTAEPFPLVLFTWKIYSFSSETNLTWGDGQEHTQSSWSQQQAVISGRLCSVVVRDPNIPFPWNAAFLVSSESNVCSWPSPLSSGTAKIKHSVGVVEETKGPALKGWALLFFLKKGESGRERVLFPVWLEYLSI